MNKLRAFIKRFLSYFKKNWTASDYPLRYREQSSSPEFEARWGKTPRWSVQVINWWHMGGLGETKEEAYANFEVNFNKFINAGNRPPRPGQGLPWKFAPDDRIRKHEALAREFARAILGENYDNVFYSNRSSLHYCGNPSQVARLVERIKEHYGIEIRDQENLLIADILEEIAESKQRKNHR